MNRNILTLVFSAITGLAFTFFVKSNLLQKIPGFQCESFGCIGLGIIYFIIALVLIPIVFGVVGFIFSSENRLKQGFFSLGISLIVMLLFVFALGLYK